MRRMSAFAASLLWLVLVLLVGYELVQKSPQTPLGPLPGHEEARRADRQVHWRASTGIMPIDRMLHEGQEACAYYRDLASDPSS